MKPDGELDGKQQLSFKLGEIKAWMEAELNRAVLYSRRESHRPGMLTSPA
jgi:hypothetical protein